MNKYMLAYQGGSHPKTKEEGQAHMELWKAWVKGLGDNVVNPGTPLPFSKLVTANSCEDDKNPDAMKGYAVIKADCMDEAVKIAQADPFLSTGGIIRVSQMMEMP